MIYKMGSYKCECGNPKCKADLYFAIIENQLMVEILNESPNGIHSIFLNKDTIDKVIENLQELKEQLQ